MATNDKKKELMVEDPSNQLKLKQTRDFAVPVPGNMPGRQPGAAATAASTGGASQGYKPSDAVTRAQDLLKQQLGQKPGAYQSQWQTQLDDIMGQILNRKPFTYDLNGDALYQQYKDRYMQQGRMAMMDTMGQAQAMTGGYGNSYAQSVGQQAYHGHLQQLNDVVPELYQLAMSKYQMEGDALADQHALLAQKEATDYGRYQDQMAEWQAERDYLAGRYDAERDYDYGRYADDRNFSYQQERDKAADDKWQAEFDEAKRQYDQNFGAKHGSDGSDSSSGNKTGGGKTGGYDTHGYTEDQIKALQKRAGIKEDGIWGPDTQKAYEAGYRHDYSPEDEVLDTGDQNHNYGTVAHDLDTLIKGGASKEEQDALLTAAYKAGHINEDQYRSLMKGYRPVLLTD
jgi:hypothetical protein